MTESVDHRRVGQRLEKQRLGAKYCAGNNGENLVDLESIESGTKPSEKLC